MEASNGHEVQSVAWALKGVTGSESVSFRRFYFSGGMKLSAASEEWKRLLA